MGRLLSLYRRRWLTAVVTLVLAFLSGHLMQSFLVERSGPGAAMWQLGNLSAGRPFPTPAVPPEVMETAALLPPPVLPGRVAEARRPLGSSCAPKLSLDAAPAATFRVVLTAPCHAETPVALRLGGLVADVATDARGHWSARLPALDAETHLSLSFDDRVLEGSVATPDADMLQHVILAWSDAPTFQISAFEFGAHAREDGHVWSGAPAVPERALRGAGGFLTRIGIAGGAGFEIYSFPSDGVAGASGVVRLSVDAKVTDENCGRLARAAAYQTGFRGGLMPTEVAFSMPGCDRVGDVVRLQNLFRDMRLASR